MDTNPNVSALQVEVKHLRRELEIEAALERVRAHTMAMHHTSELQRVIHSVHEELLKLDLSISGGSFIVINSEIETEIHCWGAGGTADTSDEVHIPRFEKPFYTNLLKGIKNGPGFFTEEFSQEEKIEFFTFLFQHEPWSGLSAEQQSETLSAHGGYTRSCAVSKHTSIFIINHFGELFSEAENDILKRFGKVFEQSYTRFLDLQKAEAQAREAQIEAALERVRSRTMAMQRSEELAEVATLLFQQVKVLGVPQFHCGFSIFEIDDKEFTWYAGSPNGDILPPSKIPLTEHPVFISFNESRKRGDELFVYEKEGEYQAGHYRYMLSLPVVGEVLQSMLDAGLTFPTFQIDHLANFSHGNLTFTTAEHFPEAHDIFKRFAKVFEQTYTRFLDLQKAEAQAREAQIEAALERVRSRTMAMQSSSELGNVAAELFAQMNKLVTNLWTCGFVLCEKDRDEDEWWLSMDGDFTRGFFLPNVGDYAHATLYEGWLKGEALRAVQLDGKSLQLHYDWLMEIPVSRTIFEEMDAAGLARPDWQKLHAAYFSKGYLVLITREPCGEEEIFKRFAQVFDQTYTRFLDLQKAEAQAREAQIEMALERVRSRTMAMQNSDELIETSELMFEQIKNLGVELWSCGFSLWYDDDSYFMGYNTGPDGKMGDPLKIPLTEDVFFTTIRDAKRRGDDFLVFESEGESLAQTYSYMDTLPVVGEFMRGIVAAGAELPKYQVTHCGFFSHGHLMFIALEHNPEAIDIFKRFTKVFEQTYTRFLDLQKAEAQAREAQIEVAVERVRAKALAMHKSTEILQVAITLKEQMEGLNVSGITAATIYLEHDDNKIRVWDITELKESENGPQLSSDFTFRLEDTDPGLWVRRVWNTKEKYSVIEMSGDDFIKCEKWIREFDETAADNYREFIRAAKIEHTWHPTVQLEKGKLNLDFTVPPPHEMEFILPKMGAAFDLAYRRFLDLQRAEKQAREAQIEASLERVRAKAMSMQNSDELDEVLSVLCEQFDVLGILPMSTHMTVFNFENNTFTFRETGKYGDRSFGEQTVELDAMDTWKETVDKWKAEKATDVNSLHFPKDTLPEVWDVFHKSFASMPEESRITPDDYPDGIYHTAGKHPFGYFGMNQTRTATGEEEEIVIKFANEFGRAYQRFLDLQKAEAQAREAQIEAALEKVRSRSLAMHKSDELNEVVKVLFEKMTELEVPSTAVGIQTFAEDTKDMQCFVCGDVGSGIVISQYHLPYFDHPIMIDYYAALENNLDYYVGTYSKEEKDSFYDIVLELPELKDLPAEVNTMIRESEVYEITMVPAKKSVMSVNDFHRNPLSGSQVNILKRFAKVFDQTYTRFLDLQKAEAQAREAQIEMALERVRSRSMAMQKSDEMLALIKVVFDQLRLLDINFDHASFAKNLQEGDFTFWTTSKGQPEPVYLEVPTMDSPVLSGVYEAKKKGADFITDFFTAEENREWSQHLIKFSALKFMPEPIKKFMLNAPGFHRSSFLLKDIDFYVGSYGSEPFTDQENAIFKRFAQVFQQSYTRFLDLQKAEAQSKEAQIEMALERVRSSTMAMQHSDELREVVATIYEQLKSLKLDAQACNIIIADKISGDREYWVSGFTEEIYPESYAVPYFDHPFINREIEAWKEGQQYAVFEYAGKEKKDFDKIFFTQTDFKKAPQEAKEFMKSLEAVKISIAYFNYGSLQILGPNPLSPENAEIFQRFAKVFEQTYTRFLDLQKAEAQAREATKQAAMDRVRGVIASMRSAADLELITPLIFRELTILGVPFIRCGVFIIQEKEEIVEAYLSSPEGNSLGVLRLPYQASELTYQSVEAWRKGEVYKQHWNKEDFVRWIKQLMEQDQIQDRNTYQGSAAPPESLDLHFVPFTQGMLYVGAVSPLDENEIELVQSLAKAFSIAYARYEDFVKLEKAKAGIEAALSELKATQSQLVQQEKLASLGQLTAGIAHEIKNPLNFVNNFSEVSIELIEEIKEERAKKQESRDETLVDEILEDIMSNLKKVYEHGSRANSIVTSMLQHSRGGDGKMEPNDLNALLKEYVNLSFHGMRAGKNPINVDIDLKLEKDLKKVNIVSEDFSRVFVNLCNNAFDAMRMKALTTLTCPELSLHKVNYNETTKRKKNKEHRISELG